MPHEIVVVLRNEAAKVALVVGVAVATSNAIQHIPVLGSDVDVEIILNANNKQPRIVCRCSDRLRICE